MRKLLYAYNSIINIGINDAMDIEQAQRIRLTNTLGVIPIFIYLFFIFFGLIYEYYFPPILCTCLLIGAIIGLYVGSLGKNLLSRSILFSINSISVFIIYNVLNIDYSITCYFFPLIMAYEMLYSFKKEKKYFSYTFSFTILCLLACFLLPKHLFYSFAMSDELLHTSIKLNFIFPLILSILFTIAIIKNSSNTHEKLNKSREESEKANKAKSNFLSNMSHELRTPLNGIIGATNLLLHEPAASLSQKKYYEVLQHSSDHMLNLINQILDFSKINEHKINLDRNVFNLHHSISKLCRVIKAQQVNEFVQFEYYIDEAINVEVVSDDLRLKQILLNLLSNAVKFTKDGTITLRADLIKKQQENLSIQFTIKDTGVGIEAIHLEKIFESFEQADTTTTRNFGGTGLGLSISKDLVKLFGASLQVESKVGEGSTFSFIIDMEMSKKDIAQSNKINNEVKNLQGLKILVAEDNKVNMLVLTTFLKKWKLYSVEVSDGAMALEKYQQQEFDLILMDLEMPIMDGYTAVEQLRKKDKSIPIIAFTAALYDGMAEDLKAKGFDGYLHKPFNPKDLYNQIAKYKKVALN
jgi:signal transduction histidine kinase/ActR/RegA family two-component response regulator